jgi:hypothetical protein
MQNQDFLVPLEGFFRAVSCVSAFACSMQRSVDDCLSQRSRLGRRATTVARLVTVSLSGPHYASKSMKTAGSKVPLLARIVSSTWHWTCILGWIRHSGPTCFTESSLIWIGMSLATVKLVKDTRRSHTVFTIDRLWQTLIQLQTIIIDLVNRQSDDNQTINLQSLTRHLISLQSVDQPGPNHYTAAKVWPNRVYISRR